MNSTRSDMIAHNDGATWINRSLKDNWRINMKSYDFLGTRFMPLTLEQTRQHISAPREAGPFSYVVTPNVDHIVRLWRETETYKPLYDGAALSVCDSRILEVLAKFSGIPLSPVPGSDLTAQLFRREIKPDEPVNIIGGDDDIIAHLRKNFKLTQLHHHQPPWGLKTKPEAIKACAEFVANHPARFTFICVGSPQQEMVAQACEARGDCRGTGLCVGASLEFLTGRIKRAPLWMQKARLEWLHRLLSEPKRLWKRYLLDGPKIFLIWISWSLGKRL
jgi:exopolysaccharide biosynthesis WecB/TagA/CpsF family protein